MSITVDEVCYPSFRGVKVYGDLYRPAKPSKAAVVIAHGGFGPRDFWSTTALELCLAGYNCLNIDFNGCGKSEGYTCWIGRIKDFSFAIDYLKAEHGFERFATMGHSGGGAYPAACAAVDDERVQAVCLWDCIFDFYEVHMAADAPDPGGNPICVLERHYWEVRDGLASIENHQEVAHHRNLSRHLPEIYEEAHNTLKHYYRPSQMLGEVQKRRKMAVLHIVASQLIGEVELPLQVAGFPIPGSCQQKYDNRFLAFRPVGLFEERYQRWFQEFGEPKRMVIMKYTTHGFEYPGRQRAINETIQWFNEHLG